MQGSAVGYQYCSEEENASVACKPGNATKNSPERQQSLPK